MKERGWIALWAALAILGAVAVLAYRTSVAALDTLGIVEHTHEVQQQLDAVSAAYSRAVTARRAYVVAGDESQLADVAALDQRMATAIATLRGLMADNPRQLERVMHLDELLAARVADLQSAVAYRRANGQPLETARGLELALQVRSVREALDQEENALVVERNARSRRDVTRAKLVEIVGTAASFAILLLLFGRLRGEIRRRRRSQEALRASEAATARANQFLDSIVENLPNMVFVKEAAELRFERINRAGEELLGVPRSALLGKNDYDFFPAEQASFFRERDHATLTSGAVTDITEEPIQTKQGERWLHTKKVPIVDPGGEPRYLLGISEDITERRQAAEEIRQARDAAQEANRELESFSYSVAHDLRAPLRGIDGFSQALVEDCGPQLDPMAREYLARVRASAQAMGELIDGLLALSRITRVELSRQEVDLSAIARAVGARLADEAQRAGQGAHRQVELVVADGLVAQGDYRLLTAVLDNLLANAWKFTGKRAAARIEVGRVPAEPGHDQAPPPTFFVKDNGAGFDMTYAKKLFGAFQRLHSVTEFEGTGIGLATVQRIIRRHGGRIWATGHVDSGATFFFHLEPVSSEALHSDSRGGDRSADQKHSTG